MPEPLPTKLETGANKMSVLLAHDHKFRQVARMLYSNGGLGNDILARYAGYFDAVTVVARIIDQDRIDGKMSDIVDKRVRILSFAAIGEQMLREEVRAADVVIGRLPSRIGLRVIEEAQRQKKSYAVEVVGCPWDALWNHSLKGKLAAPMMTLLTKKAVKNAPNALYVTDQFLQQRYPCRGNSVSCSDVELPETDEGVLRQRLERIRGRDPSQPLIIGTMAATDVRYKGQEYVIRAIAELKKQGVSARYWIIGSGNTAYLQSVSEAYSVTENVIFVGSLPHQQVFEYLDKLDIYVQPSLVEGMPRALIEAMSRACPAVGSRVGGIPELLDEECVFEGKNVQELTEKLVSCARSMEKKAVRNFNKAKRSETRFIWDSRNDVLSANTERI